MNWPIISGKQPLARPYGTHTQQVEPGEYQQDLQRCDRFASTPQSFSRLFIQEKVYHLPVLAFTGHRKRRDSSVVGRVDIHLVVHQKIYDLVVAILHCQVDGSIPVLN